MKRVFRYHETYVAIAIVLLAAIFGSQNPGFLSLENLLDLLKSYSFLGIFAVGVLLVLISGGIDISFTATATVAEYVMALIIVNRGGNIFTAILIVCIIGIILGTINALLIYYFRVPSIITTIATLNIYYGLLIFFSEGKWIYSLPSWFNDFASLKVITLANESGAHYGLSVITLLWFIIIAAGWFILKYTRLGRGLYAMGGNPRAASRIGFNMFHLHFFVYGFMGMLAGIAGLVHALMVQTVAPNSIVGKELDVIAAVVLGGASLFGGTGTMSGMFLGVMLIAVMSNGLTMMRVPSYYYNIFIGLIILVSVGFSAIQHKKCRVKN